MQIINQPAFILDVEGVLCNGETLIHPDFKSWLMRWSKNKKVFLTTDNNFSQTLYLLGSYLCLSVTEIHHSCGNAVWSGGMEKGKSRWQVPTKAQAWLEFELRKSEFQTHATDRLVSRAGMVYASVIGLTPSDKEKTNYITWDKQYSERKTIADAFNTHFTEFDAHLSGDYGICITELGKNKGQLVTKLHNEKIPIIYFGHNISDYSCSKTIVNRLDVGDKWHDLATWQDTWKLLKTEYA